MNANIAIDANGSSHLTEGSSGWFLWVASIHEGTTTPGMQAAPVGHFDVWEFVPIPGGDFSLLVGAANQGSFGLICSDFTFAADITAIDLSAATFARSSGNAAIHPHVMIGF
jgi:hypothetical protein